MIQFIKKLFTPVIVPGPKQPVYELTPWFAPKSDGWPVREGVYEVKSGHGHVPAYCWWNGEHFEPATFTAEEAAEGPHGPDEWPPSYLHGRPWRGILK